MTKTFFSTKFVYPYILRYNFKKNIKFCIVTYLQRYLHILQGMFRIIFIGRVFPINILKSEFLFWGKSNIIVHNYICIFSTLPSSALEHPNVNWEVLGSLPANIIFFQFWVFNFSCFLTSNFKNHFSIKILIN